MHQAFDGAASTVQLPMLACGEREAIVVTQQYHLAFMAASFPPQAFPLQSPPSAPLDPSFQPLPWDHSTLPKLELPAIVPSRRPESLSGVCMAVARTV